MNHPQVNRALKNFGLTENEIAVYIEALKHEETSPFALATATGIPRTTVYDVLTSLSLKQLIELKQSDGLQKQQTKIKAKNPSILRQILQSRRKELTATEVDIVHILPLLKDPFHAHIQSADFQFLPGIEGVKQVYFHKFPSSEPKYVFENMMPMDVFGADTMNQFTATETSQNITANINHRELIPLTDWTRHVLSYQYGLSPDYIKARNMRFIDNPIFDNHLSITIQGKRTHISCAHQDEIYGLIITSETLANTLKALFEVAWLAATPITNELIESWGPNEYREAEMQR